MKNEVLELNLGSIEKVEIVETELNFSKPIE